MTIHRHLPPPAAAPVGSRSKCHGTLYIGIAVVAHVAVQRIDAIKHEGLGIAVSCLASSGWQSNTSWPRRRVRCRSPSYIGSR